MVIRPNNGMLWALRAPRHVNVVVGFRLTTCVDRGAGGQGWGGCDGEAALFRVRVYGSIVIQVHWVIMVVWTTAVGVGVGVVPFMWGRAENVG